MLAGVDSLGVGVAVDGHREPLAAGVGLGGARQAGRGREGKSRRRARRHGQRPAVTFAQHGDNLPELHDLPGGGQDEGSQAFPRVLAQQSQAAASGNRRAHGLVIRKGAQHLAQVSGQLQVMRQPIPVGNGLRCLRPKPARTGIEPDPAAANHADPDRVAPLPAKGLAASERGGQIVVAEREGCCRFQAVHRRSRQAKSWSRRNTWPP